MAKRSLLIQYLVRLLAFCRRISGDHNLPAQTVLPGEKITRFLYKNDFNAHGKIYPAAFQPSFNSLKKEISLYRTDQLPDIEIQVLAVEFVDKRRGDGKRVRAQGNLFASEIIDKQLSVISDTVPHARHANITGWPNDRPEIKMRALELANQARLLVFPPGRSEQVD